VSPLEPSVSIVVPAFNAEPTIAATVESVLAQSVPDFELLIADDCSSDGTARVVAAFADARIRLLRNESKLGPGRSRDALIAAARGRWIAFLDADDAWATERLEVLLAHADRHRDAMVFDELLLCQQKGAALSPWKSLGRRRDYGVAAGASGEVSLPAYLLGRSLLIKPLVPLAAIRSAELTHSARSYGEDAEFFIRLMQSGLRCRYLDQAMYYYRLTPGSLSAQASRPEQLSLVLDSLRTELDFDAQARAAFEVKLARLKTKADCDRFLAEFHGGRYKAGMGRLMTNPPVMIEFAKRVPGLLAKRARALALGTRGR